LTKIETYNRRIDVIVKRYHTLKTVNKKQQITSSYFQNKKTVIDFCYNVLFIIRYTDRVI